MKEITLSNIECINFISDRITLTIEFNIRQNKIQTIIMYMKRFISFIINKYLNFIQKGEYHLSLI